MNKTIIFPKEMDKILKAKVIPTIKVGYYKPHQIYHVLSYKRLPTHTYIQITGISQSTVASLPKHLASHPEFKKFPPARKIEILHFNVIYEDEYLDTDGYGNSIPKVFNFHP